MKNILIVDDNKDILNALQVGLRGFLKNCTILTALNTKRAAEILNTTPVDLILTDLDMPVKNGYRFIELSRISHGAVPVCVMTGSCTEADRERLQALGVKQIIEKPFQFENLSSLIAGELGLEEHALA